MENNIPAGFRFICPDDCGNAPKKTLLRDITRAAVQADFDFVKEHIADSVVWDIIGDQKIEGLQSFMDTLRQMHAKPALELEIRHLITHGKTGAVSGTVKYEEGSRSFCDVYVFNNSSKTAKIKEVTSYMIELQD